MSTRLYLYAAWCLMLLGGTAWTSYYAWSPFSDGQRAARTGFYGPTHK